MTTDVDNEESLPPSSKRLLLHIEETATTAPFNPMEQMEELNVYCQDMASGQALTHHPHHHQQGAQLPVYHGHEVIVQSGAGCIGSEQVSGEPQHAVTDDEVAKLEKALGINLKNGGGAAEDLPSPAAVHKALLAK